MSNKTITIEQDATVCDICNKAITTKLRLYWDSNKYTTELTNRFFFIFKTMHKGITGKTYDAHGQCAADVLSKYIEDKAAKTRSKSTASANKSAKSKPANRGK